MKRASPTIWPPRREANTALSPTSSWRFYPATTTRHWRRAEARTARPRGPASPRTCGRPSGRRRPRARCSRTTGSTSRRRRPVSNSRGSAYHGSEIKLRLRQPLRHELVLLDGRGISSRSRTPRSDYGGELRDPRATPTAVRPHPLARGEPPIRDHDGTRRRFGPLALGGDAAKADFFGRFFASQEAGLVTPAGSMVSCG
ncbi:hypothetical protein ACRAWF_21135 [Streptomyces sp. L7]